MNSEACCYHASQPATGVLHLYLYKHTHAHTHTHTHISSRSASAGHCASTPEKLTASCPCIARYYVSTFLTCELGLISLRFLKGATHFVVTPCRQESVVVEVRYNEDIQYIQLPKNSSG